MNLSTVFSASFTILQYQFNRMLYYLIIALQVFCIYHLYKNKNEYYWIFLILFLPFLGSIIYLIVKVYNIRDAEKLQEGISTIINPSKRLTDLESKLEFSDTFQNKVNLADAYFETGNYKNAIGQYEDAIIGSFQNDIHVIKQLMEAYGQLEEYDKVISYAERIQTKFEFKASRSQFLYGIALEKTNRLAEAEQQLQQINIPNSNYNERLVFAKFLKDRNRVADAKELLTEIQQESQYMIKTNKRIYSATIQEVEQLLKEL